METHWVPAVNNHGGFGRWAFLEKKRPAVVVSNHPDALVTTRRRPSAWRAASIWSRREA
jgi:hypothetical protein